jgi:hypothetical protein
MDTLGSSVLGGGQPLASLLQSRESCSGEAFCEVEAKFSRGAEGIAVQAVLWAFGFSARQEELWAFGVRSEGGSTNAATGRTAPIEM